MTPDSRHTLVGVGAALALHAALGVGLVLMPGLASRRPQVVEFEVRRKPPPPPPVLTPPEPPKPPPEPERKIVKKVTKPAETPKPAQAPPPPQPVKPIFGVPEKDTVGQSSVALPEGNTTLANPNERPKGPVVPLPPAAGAPGKEYHPVTELDLKRLPEHDKEACGEAIKEKYSTSQAFTDGIEGEVAFRVELDETGKIHSIRKIKGLGHGLDEMAMGYLRFNPACKFKPAIAKDGKPAAYVINPYTFIFEIPR